ncbi:hypothetical protein ATW55_12275 [Ferroacidibacillus organovorans]|uniref:Uncharacterized protein n=1 Tax=Ferroacidibacillus organovorans TaxID=1765683 RepID=A0A117SYK1_9BACL|nr:hypothetical protein ATW55_12275 [Ferroacidibacillus organovorans]
MGFALHLPFRYDEEKRYVRGDEDLEPTQMTLTYDEMTKRLSKAIDKLQEIPAQSDRAGRIAVAHAALELSRECVEAWLVLAQEAGDDPEKVRSYLEEALQAGDRLFEEKRESWLGRFGQLPQTRAYMQARAALAQVLWDMGDHDRAISTLFESLELNEKDPLSMRYLLLKALQDKQDFEALDRLLKMYESDTSTTFSYARLLCAFALYGDSLPARSAFLQAKKVNPHVLDFLLGLRVMPNKLPKTLNPGDESEAIRYTAAFGDAWLDTDNAIEYLRAQKKKRTEKEAQRAKR